MIPGRWPKPNLIFSTPLSFNSFAKDESLKISVEPYLA